MPTILQQPANPDELARHAGRTMYGTVVGVLRRVELYRLGNAWGFKFPVGASKEYMLPFFQRLEAEGKNPLFPPNAHLDTLVKRRECEFSQETHATTAPQDMEIEVSKPDEIKPGTKGEFEIKLEALHISQVRKFCRQRGIEVGLKDRKQDLIARIVAAKEGNDLEQDSSSGC